jgi:hypothetical protein
MRANPLDLDGWDERISTAQNMEHVDDYIPLIPGVLAMGGPIRGRLTKALSTYIEDTVASRKALKRQQLILAGTPEKEDTEEIVVCTLVDVTDNTTDEPWWRKDLPPSGIEINREHKLEARRGDDDDLDPVKLMEAARYVKMQCNQGRLVYVVGYECTRVACVVSLLAWVLYKNERKRDPVEYLRKDILRDVSWITRDFPASDTYVAVIQQLTTQHRKSVEAAFPGLKAIKRPPTNKKQKTSLN